jgi:hypothetical protein
MATLTAGDIAAATQANLDAYVQLPYDGQPAVQAVSSSWDNFNAQVFDKQVTAGTRLKAINDAGWM